MGFLLELAGLPSEPCPRPGDDLYWEALPLVEVAARGFLLGGGHVSGGEFVALSELEREALVQAGHGLAVAQAIRIGRAMGPLGAEAVAAEVDGGEEYDDALLELSMKAVAKAQREAMRGRSV